MRKIDAGKDGPLERAANCIEQLLGRIHELEETISEMTPKEELEENDPEVIQKKMTAGAARHWFNRCS